MLADLVAVPDAQIAALAREVLVERVGSQNGARRNLVVVAHRSPALDVDVGLEDAPLADSDVGFHDAEITDPRAWADNGIGVNTGCRSDDGRGIDGHEVIW